MKKNLKNLWGKRIFSSFLSISFLLSGISPAFNVSAASPASVPDTLTLKESAGVCSGNSVAFNVRSNAFNSSKLKFYQDMLVAVIQRQMLPPNLVHQMQLRQKTGLTSLIYFTEIVNRSLVPAITAQEWKLCVILRSLNIITLVKYPIMNIRAVMYGIFIATALIIVIHLVMQIQISVKNYMNIIWHSTRAVATKKAGIPATKVQQTALNLWKIIQIKMSFGLF